MLQWLAIYFCIGVAGTWLARRYAIRQSLIDQPGERRSHDVATPRGGGIAIVIAVAVAACALALQRPLDAPLLAAFGVGLLLVAGIGWVDDHRPLSPWWRLIVHVVAAGLFGLAVADVYQSPWLGACAFAATIGLTNVWNFMDGINGLAASQAALVAAGLAAMASGVWGLLGMALAAACIGFLPFNFPRARIFLGDVGSGAIGFSVAALAVVAGARLGSHFWVVLLPLSVFLVDAGLTLLRRLLRGERWWTPHTQHAYQAWARSVGHNRVTLAYAGATAVAILAAFWLASHPDIAFITSITLAWYTCCAFLWVGLQKAGSFRTPTSI
ncbi:lipopolysaccharide biosynthesis protein [Lysobacter sp. TAF61]|uniref:lipopolysaccharide biosynthesis protein n=1 Tax=Lysobacter sp. TAF61 TaxID=3233072 RepID=UPI003F9B9320